MTLPGPGTRLAEWPSTKYKAFDLVGVIMSFIGDFSFFLSSPDLVSVSNFQKESV